MRADGLFQLDFSLLKVFPVSESKSFEFRAEFFNLTNTPTFSAPVSTVDISSGGQVSSTLNSARVIQFGIKFHF
ncbi:MAG TPA: hypothetical protein VGX94_10485 [Terriglobia bacterium]|nr:hypothetical protein [Terriglobia bacterium]